MPLKMPLRRMPKKPAYDSSISLSPAITSGGRFWWQQEDDVTSMCG
jgi:hypothetical protein